MIIMRVAAAVAALALAGAAAAQQPGAPEIWETMSVAQARSLAAEIGAEVSGVEPTDGGGFAMHLTEADGLVFEVRGLECAGAGEARACPEFDFIAYFEADSAADAVAMAERIDVIWVNDTALDDGVMVVRMNILHGGVTRAHMRRQFENFIEALWVVRDQAYPEG